MGQEKSGTPIETREGVSDLSAMYQQMMSQPGGPGAEFSRMSSEAMINMLGFDPSAMGLGEAVQSSLIDPANSTQGLFRAMRPFEERQTATQTAGIRDMFGTMGGRFSRNAAEGEAQLRSQLGAEFGRNREQALLQAQGMRNQALASILPNMINARSQAFNEQTMPFQLMNQFLQPGAPQWQEGLLPGLIGAGTNLAGLLMMGGGKG